MTRDAIRDLATPRWGWTRSAPSAYVFDDHGLMRRRGASINDVAIDETNCRIFGLRPEGSRTAIPLE